VRIRPTRLGLEGALLLAALGVGFFATAYGNLLFLLLVFCAALGALDLCWALQNLRGLRAQWLAVPPAAAGSPREVALLLARDRRGGSFDVAVLAEPGGVAAEIAHAPLLRGELRLAAQAPPLPRGLHPVRALRLVSRFPFGLFQATRDVPAAAEFVTHPVPCPAAGRAAAGHEANPAAAAIRGASVAGLRPFRAGDPLADVDWKASARRAAPIVKEREREGDAVEVVLDRRCAPAALEAALRAAAGILLQANAAGRPVLWRSQGETGHLAPRAAAPTPLLRWLAGAEPLPPDAPPPPRGSPGAVHLPGESAEARHA